MEKSKSRCNEGKDAEQGSVDEVAEVREDEEDRDSWRRIEEASCFKRPPFTAHASVPVPADTTFVDGRRSRSLGLFALSLLLLSFPKKTIFLFAQSETRSLSWSGPN